MTTYRLTYPPSGRATAPVLDEFQRAVVDHDGGPLLVLAGPGTGKTTTLVEAVVDRIENRGASPESVLVLTFSRKAAEGLRDRITGRLGTTMSTQLSSTFHSFAYALLRGHTEQDLYAAPLRLLSAPEQDVALRDLLLGTRQEDTVAWPPNLAEALRTRGFTRELQGVLARAREKGLEPFDLARVGAEEGRPEWVAAARFMEEYLTSLDFTSAIDYPELIHRAVLMAERPAIQDALRRRYSHVFVDEYQDTDPSQVRLLRALAGNGRNLTVVGDPDQSIYAFRGAELRGLLEFPDAFPTRDGERAPVLALQNTRRFGPRLLAASRAVAGQMSIRGPIDAEAFARFRNPSPSPNVYGDGVVEVRLFDSPTAETDHIADILRRAHLEDEVPWSQMAVLVRSGVASIPRLRRTLPSAGVPVAVAGDELPLAQEPSVAPLLSALQAARDLASLTVEDAHYLLTSPLGGLDGAQHRSLARRLRADDRDAHRDERPPLSSGELIRTALLQPGSLGSEAGRPAEKTRALGLLLFRAAKQLASGRTAEEVLWTLWSGSTWPGRLRSAVDRGGPQSRHAHRDLDAVCALFEVAARAEEKRDHTSVATFLDEIRAQQIPADTLADRGVRGDAVRLLTAHRSKGLEWRLVVVAGVQEGSWPDIRRRGSLLQADRIGVDGMVPPTTTAAMVAEERRLFYVATTRARQRLVVTAVKSPEEDGDQPSRFVYELDTDPEPRVGRPERPLSLPGLVADLRLTLADPEAPEPVKRAAARRLAQLAAAEHDGDPLVPQAHPDNWWGMREQSRSETPLRPEDQPVSLSASALDGLVSCPVRWFLQREAAGSAGKSLSQGFGLVMHALVDRVGKGDIGDETEMIGYVDSIWDQLVFDTPWSRERQRVEAHAMVHRFFAWNNDRGSRSYLESERSIRATVTLPDDEQVTLHGFVDRLELDESGRVVIIDFKTGKRAAPEADLPEHPQLGLYQLAVENGAVADIAGADARSGGAELVHLRVDAKGLPKTQKQEPQQPDEQGRRPVELQLMTAAEVVRSEELTARANRACAYCDFATMCPVKGGGSILG